MKRRTIMEIQELATKIDRFLKEADYYGYMDADCNVDYVTECLMKDPYSIIEYLIDIVLDYAMAEETAEDYVKSINHALDLSKQVYENI